MRVAVLVNRVAGRGHASRIQSMVRHEFRDHDVTCFADLDALESFVRYRQHERPEFHREPTPDVAGCLVLAVGGDGTLNRLVARILPHHVTVGVIPSGRANDFARVVGTSPDPEEACRNLLRPRVASVDIVLVNGRPLLTCGGLGLISDVARRANRWSEGEASPLARLLGSRCYSAAAFVELMTPGKSLRLWAAGDDEDSPVQRRIPAEVSALVVSNQSSFGGGFSVSPLARHDDGVVDLCLIPRCATLLDRLRLFRQTWRVGDPSSQPFQQLRGSRFFIRTEKPCVFSGDGEVLARGMAFAIRVLPSRLSVALPAPHSTTPAAVAAA